MAEIPPVSLVIKAEVTGEGKVAKLSGQIEGLSGVARTSSGGIASLGDALELVAVKADDAGNRFGALGKTLVDFGQANIGIAFMRRYAGALVDLADEYGQMASRIKMVSADTEEFDRVQARLLNTASGTYRPLAEAQEVYIRTSDALKSLGYNTEQALDVTDSLSYLFVTNAASGERAAGAIAAFSKALNTGRIDAIGWQTIMAAVPSIVRNLAEATGKSEEEIRRLGASGKLALTDFTEALRKTADANRVAAESMPTTLRDGFTALTNGIQAYLGGLNDALSITNTAGGILGDLGRNANVLGQALIWAGVGAGGRFALSMAAAAASAIRAGQAFTIVSTALQGLKVALLSPAGVAAIAAVGAAIYALCGKSDEAAKSLANLADTAESVFEKFDKMGEAQKLDALRGLEKEADAAKKAYSDLARELLKMSETELSGGWFGDEAVGKAKETFEAIGHAARRAAAGGEEDWSRFIRMLNEADISPKVKDAFIAQFAALEKLKGEADAVGLRHIELKGRMEDTARAANNVTVALKKPMSREEVQKQIKVYGDLAAAIKKARAEKEKEARGYEKDASDKRETGNDKLAAAQQKAAEMRMQDMDEEERKLQALREAHKAKGQAYLETLAAMSKKQSGDMAGFEAALAHAEQLLEKAQRFAEQSGNAYLVESIGRDQKKVADQQAEGLDAKADKARADLAAMTVDLQKYLDEIDKLKANPVAIEMEGVDEAIDEVNTLVDALGGLEDKTVTVTTNYVSTGNPPPIGESVPGFARGGVLPGHSPHDRADNLIFLGTAGDFVVRRAVTRQAGALAFLERFNRMGMRALPQRVNLPELVMQSLPKFADGGLLPAAPAQAGNLAPTILNFPGVGEYPAQMAVDVQAELVKVLKREALKRGRR
ncbi:MAG: tape measure protein [Zoogloeaceae bacterium]|jgi:tape measure domain-containing protein|nr:tape measure protein [Zoogloeaceae bacterium]